MSNVLLGTAIGDALGVPFETKPADFPLLLNWDGETYLGSEHHELKPGQFSDDTQMSMMVAQSLIDNKGFNPNDLSSRYVDWIFSGKARGYGRTTMLACQALKDGTHWNKSGVPGSYGNGTAMRAASFGVFFKNDKVALLEAATIDAKITHNSDEAIAGSRAIALAAFCIANKNESDLLDEICMELPASTVLNKLLAFNELLAMKNVSPTHILQGIGTKADVRQTAPAALFCYLKNDNYKDAVLMAIRAGGDTDTTAAITGALCSIKYGFKGINKAWVDGIEDKDKLIALDNQLNNSPKD